MPGNKNSTLSATEMDRLSDFLRYASQEWASSQHELAEIAGISQSMIAYGISQKRSVGGKVLKAISEATGVSIESILSGAGLAMLRARDASGLVRDQAIKRNKAAEALSILFDLPFSDAENVFIENRIILPGSAPVSSWFDIGRAYIEERMAVAMKPELKPTPGNRPA